MNSITLERQMPISQARNKLASLKSTVKKKRVLYLLKNYKPHMALIDLDYLEELERRANLWKMEHLVRQIQDDFDEVLRSKGHNPETVDEKTVKKLLMIGKETVPIRYINYQGNHNVIAKLRTLDC